eukprot:TRINITY_DN2848_c1_g1_i3.p1 TRINITY_DN2848_c1_g1~~TRINITY_DN2848_c1_g1_i3.p1  ORF type:complete len:376 (+),score=133.43 TRINITY_DN2848_c1_g1_i3:128-1255(+)
MTGWTSVPRVDSIAALMGWAAAYCAVWDSSRDTVADSALSTSSSQDADAAEASSVEAADTTGVDSRTGAGESGENGGGTSRADETGDTGGGTPQADACRPSGAKAGGVPPPVSPVSSARDVPPPFSPDSPAPVLLSTPVVSAASTEDASAASASCEDEVLKALSATVSRLESQTAQYAAAHPISAAMLSTRGTEVQPVMAAARALLEIAISSRRHKRTPSDADNWMAQQAQMVTEKVVTFVDQCTLFREGRCEFTAVAAAKRVMMHDVQAVRFSSLAKIDGPNAFQLESAKATLLHCCAKLVAELEGMVDGLRAPQPPSVDNADNASRIELTRQVLEARANADASMKHADSLQAQLHAMNKREHANSRTSSGQAF